MGIHPFPEQVSDVSFLIFYYTEKAADFKNIFMDSTEKYRPYKQPLSYGRPLFFSFIVLFPSSIVPASRTGHENQWAWKYERPCPRPRLPQYPPQKRWPSPPESALFRHPDAAGRVCSWPLRSHPSSASAYPSGSRRFQTVSMPGTNPGLLLHSTPGRRDCLYGDRSLHDCAGE